MARKKMFAAIDVGSHEIHMQIAEFGRDGAPVVVETIARTLAIGTDTYITGMISQPLIDTCAEVLRGFVKIMRGYRIDACRAVATSAFREASNRDFAVDQIRRASGLEIEVLSNAQERSYQLLAVSGQISGFADYIRQGTLVLDLGSGSVQATVFDKSQFVFTQNLLLGSLRVRELLADLERQAANYASLMEQYVAGTLAFYHQMEPKNIAYRHVVVSGGELSNLKKMCGQPSDQATQMSARRLEQIYRQLLQARPLDLETEFDIAAEHASLLLPTAMLIRKFIRFTGVDAVDLASTGLADALLIEYARERHGFVPSHDLSRDLISGCRHLARRYRVDSKHSSQVERLALVLFDESSRLHGLTARHRLLLQAAAILHESGKFVNLTRPQRMSGELVLSTELPGVAPEEQRLIAEICADHAGAGTVAPDGGSEPPERRLTRLKLVALLRIADALDTGNLQKISGLSLQMDENQLTLVLTVDEDVTLELWAVQSRGALFRELFGVQIRIRVRGT